MYPHQAERLDGVLARLGVRALVAASPANVAYVTGFRSPSRELDPTTPTFAVYTRAGTALVVPAVDAPAAFNGDADADHLLCYGRFDVAVAERADAAARRAADAMAAAAASPVDALAAALRARGIADGAIGLDTGPLPESTGRTIAERLEKMKLEPASVALAEARAVKGPYEIDCLQQALWMAEEAIHEVLGELTAGITEREAAAIYERALGRRGARPTSTLIAFGPNTALPATRPGERPLRAGDFVRFDVGSLLKGYHAEIARMAILGEPTAAQQTRYDAVEAGIDAALRRIRPAATPGAVFDAATAAVRAAGIAEYRRDHVGHGIGLDPAEPPWLTPDGAPLEAGMVLGVETPFYMLGGVGLQVKETVLVNQGGTAVMNRSNRGLVVLD